MSCPPPPPVLIMKTDQGQSSSSFADHVTHASRIGIFLVLGKNWRFAPRACGSQAMLKRQHN